MKGDYTEIVDSKTGETKDFDYLCQGILHIKDEMDLDEEAK